MKRIIRTTLALAATAAVASACQRNSDQADRSGGAGQPNPPSAAQSHRPSAESLTRDARDGWITTKLEARYFVDPDVKGRQVDVSTENGVVTLRGTVDTERAHQQAVSLARGTDGVTDVRDQLAVAGGGSSSASNESGGGTSKSSTGTTGVQNGNDASNAWVTTRILSAYFVDPLVKGRRIDVNANNGVVTLRGTVDSPEERDKAISIARGIDGVRRVDSRLEVANAVAAAPDTSTAQGLSALNADQMSDPGITARIQSKYFVDDLVKSRAITVASNNGRVTLTGTVPNDAAKQRAVQIAHSVEGVRDVDDQLTVKQADQLPRVTQRSNVDVATGGDAWITTQIQSHYFIDDTLKPANVNVTTTRGVVTLTGTVPDNAAKQHAAEIAQSVSGVSRVVDQLQVGTGNAQASAPRQ